MTVYKKSKVKARVATFRNTMRDSKNQEENEKLLDDLVLFDRKAGGSKRMNNLYNIKVKVEGQIKQNEAQKNYQQVSGIEFNEGPSSKKNYYRYQRQVKGTMQMSGARKIHILGEVIQEEDMHEDMHEETVNPMISNEYKKIIEAAHPIQTMQQLLGLND